MSADTEHELNMDELNKRLHRKSVGTFKLKDLPGKDLHKIDNKSGEFMVLKEIWLKKIPGSSRFEVILIYPDPELVNVSWDPEVTVNKRN